MRKIIQARSPQFLRLAALFLVIVLGLALRRFGYAADLPFIVVMWWHSGERWFICSWRSLPQGHGSTRFG
ncbi:hypothetical protein ACVIRM_002757 [Rhizobium laguerreae]